MTEPSILHAVPNGATLDFCLRPYEFDNILTPVQYWHLDNSRMPGCTPDIDIDAPEAWDIYTGSSSQLIAVLDSGIDGDHEDLRALAHYCPAPPEKGHGTMVAGLLGASTDNDLGIAAVDWAAVVGCYDIWRYIGPPDSSFVQVMTLVRQALDDGASILNCSWRASSPWAESFHPAFVDAYKADALVVAAQGNTQDYVGYPAGWDHGSLGVGSVDCLGAVQGLSCNEHVDVAAPGVMVFTTCSVDTECVGGYITTGGTSIATPIVSGVASLLRGYAVTLDMNLSADDVAWMLRLGAVDVGPAGWDLCSGWGLVKAHRTLSFLADPESHAFAQLSALGYSTIDDQTPVTEYVLRGVPEWGQPPEQPFTGRLQLRKIEVRKIVDYGVDAPLESVPVVWGRGGAYTRGLADAGPGETVWGYGYCEPAGSATDEHCELRTWVYHQEAEDRWFPCPYDQVVWEYSVLWGAGAASDAKGGEGPLEMTGGAGGVRVIVGNPQAGSVLVRLWTREPQRLRVSVLDLQGRVMSVLADGEVPAGERLLRWIGTVGERAGRHSGMYWVRVDGPEGVLARRLVVLD